MFDCVSYARNHTHLMEMSEEVKSTFESLQGTEGKVEELEEKLAKYRDITKGEICADIGRLEHKKAQLLEELKIVDEKLKDRRLRLCKTERRK